MSETTVYVHVTTSIPIKQLHRDDRCISGLYAVDLDGDTPAEATANAALDGFHRHYGIEVLDDFEITVRASAQPQSVAIEQADGYENGNLEPHVDTVTYMGPIPADIAARKKRSSPR